MLLCRPLPDIIGLQKAIFKLASIRNAELSM
jgi:hypothetical protein